MQPPFNKCWCRLHNELRRGFRCRVTGSWRRSTCSWTSPTATTWTAPRNLGTPADLAGWLAERELLPRDAEVSPAAPTWNAELRAGFRQVMVAHHDGTKPDDPELTAVAAKLPLQLSFDHGDPQLVLTGDPVDRAPDRCWPPRRQPRPAEPGTGSSCARRRTAGTRSTTARRTSPAPGAAWPSAATGRRPAPTAVAAAARSQRPHRTDLSRRTRRGTGHVTARLCARAARDARTPGPSGTTRASGSGLVSVILGKWFG